MMSEYIHGSTFDTNASNVISPPFSFKACILTDLQQIHDTVVRNLIAASVSVYFIKLSAGECHGFHDTRITGLDGDDVDDNSLFFDTPIVLHFQSFEWASIKSRLTIEGFRKFCFVEDIFLPRRTYSDATSQAIPDLMDNLAYTLVETGAFTRADMDGAT